MVETTICIPCQKGNPPLFLLALKKRGFGMGKITGVGGKIEAGETPAASAVRELAEEIGIDVDASHLVYRGVIDFLFPYKAVWNMRSHLFVVTQWQGNPTESEEVAPRFYTAAQIPYAAMWADARHWLPPILAGEQIRARFVFAADNESITEWEVVCE